MLALLYRNYFNKPVLLMCDFCRKLEQWRDKMCSFVLACQQCMSDIWRCVVHQHIRANTNTWLQKQSTPPAFETGKIIAVEKSIALIHSHHYNVLFKIEWCMPFCRVIRVGGSTAGLGNSMSVRLACNALVGYSTLVAKIVSVKK